MSKANLSALFRAEDEQSYERAPLCSPRLPQFALRSNRLTKRQRNRARPVPGDGLFGGQDLRRCAKP